MSAVFRELVEELERVCSEYGCQAVSATYISPLDGRAVALQVTAGGIVTLEDDCGNLHAVAWEGR